MGFFLIFIGSLMSMDTLDHSGSTLTQHQMVQVMFGFGMVVLGAVLAIMRKED